MAIQIQLRNDTAANWTTANPVLAVGELGLESDTGNYKIGDGVNTWSALPYGGVDGASAYDIAVANGFVGTEQDWLNSLVGADGANGQGVPTGGTAGQVLSKVDGTDYNTAWTDVASGSSELVQVNVFNSSANTITAGSPVRYIENSGSGTHYIVEPWPTDGSGNSFSREQFLGIALADITGSFGEGQVLIAGSTPVSDLVFTWNGYLYFNANDGTFVASPAGNPVWNTPIGRVTSGNGNAVVTLEPWLLDSRLSDLPDVSINYGTVADGDVLSFNSSNFQFEFRTPSGGGGSAVNDNELLNGGFDIWQEINEHTQNITKTTVVSTPAYFADNWKATQFGGTGNLIQERIDVRNAFASPVTTKYGLQATVSADPGGFEFSSYIEDVETFNDEIITVSAWVKRSLGGFVININDQFYGNGGSPTDNLFGPGATLNADEWTFISGQVTVPSTDAKTIATNNRFEVKFNFQNIQANEVVSIAQVKVERGSAATTFKPKFASKSLELQACQRYYYRIKPAGNAASSTFTRMGGNLQVWTPHPGGLTTDVQVYQYVKLPVEMRTLPTFSVSNTGNFRFSFDLGKTISLASVPSLTETTQDYAYVFWFRDTALAPFSNGNAGDGYLIAETVGEWMEFSSRY